jgi:hypothetical protein
VDGCPVPPPSAHLPILLGLLLAPALPLVHAQTPPYAIQVAGATPPLANHSLALVVSGPPEALGPNVVQNPGFDQVAPWQRVTGGLGPRATATVDQGTGLLKASQTAAPGLIYIYQQMPYPGGTLFRLRYRAIDEGATPTRITILLRETFANGTQRDTRFNHFAAPDWGTYNWTWSPHGSGTGLALYLQGAIAAGTEQQVRFDDVSLAPVPQVRWEAPQGSILDSEVLSAHVVFRQKGLQRVYANATDGGVRLWSAVGSFDVPNVPPQASLQAPAQPLVNQPLVLDASGSLDADAPLALQDPTFAGLGSTWQAVGREVGGTLRATPVADPRGGLLLSVNGTKSAGTVYAYQVVPLVEQRPATLFVRVQDAGDLDGYLLLLRERNGTTQRDTAYRFPPAGQRERPLSMAWTPQLPGATQLVVYLRFQMGAGKSAQVRFLEPRLFAGLTFTWSLDGRPLGSTPTPTLELLPRQPGPHNATVEVADENGGRARASVAMDYIDPGFAWGTPPPPVAPLEFAVPLGLDTIRRVEGAEQQVANGGFAQGVKGWTLVAAEVGGGASWSVRSEAGVPYAHLHANATTAGSVYLQQDPDRLCVEVNCTLSFDYRGTAPLDTILRSRNATGAPADVHVARPAARPWTHVETPWPLAPDVGRLTLYLRAQLGAGQSADVDFRNVVLQPTLHTQAAVAGPGDVQVANGTAAFGGPGAYTVHVDVSNPYGQAGGFDRPVQVLPLAFFPTASGQLGVRLDAAAPASLVLLAADGPEKVRLALTEEGLAAVAGIRHGSQRFLRLPAAPTDRILLESGGQQGAFAAAALPGAGAGGLAAADASLQNVGWGSVVHVRVRSPDQATFNGTVRLAGLAGKALEAPLVRDGDGLAADIPLPLSFQPRAGTLTYDVRDAWGDSLGLAPQPLRVPANPLLAGGVTLAVVAAVAVAAGLAYRFLPRGRSP